MNHIIKTIKLKMMEKNLTQEDLIKPLGVTTRGAVGHYMCGRRGMGVDQLANLAKFLGMPLDELVSPPKAPQKIPIANLHQDKKPHLLPIKTQEDEQIIKIFARLTKSQCIDIIEIAEKKAQENEKIIAELTAKQA